MGRYLFECSHCRTRTNAVFRTTIYGQLCGACWVKTFKDAEPVWGKITGRIKHEKHKGHVCEEEVDMLKVGDATIILDEYTNTECFQLYGKTL